MACGGRIMFQTCLLVSNGWKSILCVYMVCGGGYDPNLIVSNGWQSSLWEGYSPILITSNGWKSIVCVCTAFGGGCGPDLDLIVSNCWKSILCVCMACRGRVRSKPDCVKRLEINSMCVHGMWRRVRVQTWLFQMAGNQSSVCMVCGGGYSPNPTVSNGWKSSLCVYMVCEGGYSPNLIVSNG